MNATISQIAKQSGISQGFLSNIIAERRRPHYKTAKRLAEATGTTPELWLEGSEDEMRSVVQEELGACPLSSNITAKTTKSTRKLKEVSNG